VNTQRDEFADSAAVDAGDAGGEVLDRRDEREGLSVAAGLG